MATHLQSPLETRLPYDAAGSRARIGSPANDNDLFHWQRNTRLGVTICLLFPAVFWTVAAVVIVLH